MPLPNIEAQKIYRNIFNKDIPSNIQKHFYSLSKKIESQFSDDEIEKYNKCVSKIYDLEALEFASRRSGKLPVLTLKFKIMLYLAETVPENYSQYINEKDAFISGFFRLMVSVFRSIYKYIKGICLLVIYKI